MQINLGPGLFQRDAFKAIKTLPLSTRGVRFPTDHPNMTDLREQLGVSKLDGDEKEELDELW